MKKFQYLIFLLGITLAGCDKEMVVTTPNFDVKASATTVQAGKAVVFSFQGNPGLISFYSGETGKDYTLKGGRTEAATNLRFDFTSSVQLGTQTNQLAVLASTNFNGDYSNFANVQQATWTDITSRFALGASATFLASGTKDISDLKADGKPLYLAFKYQIKPQNANGAARTWMVQTTEYIAVTSSGTYTVADMNSTGWQFVLQNPTVGAAGSSAIATRITFAGTVYSATNDPASEIWAISKPLPTGNMDLGLDRPVAIKGNSDAAVTQYSYTYAKAGTYKATFVAANANSLDSKEVVRTIDIVVSP